MGSSEPCALDLLFSKLGRKACSSSSSPAFIHFPSCFGSGLSIHQFPSASLPALGLPLSLVRGTYFLLTCHPLPCETIVLLLPKGQPRERVWVTPRCCPPSMRANLILRAPPGLGSGSDLNLSDPSTENISVPPQMSLKIQSAI